MRFTELHPHPPHNIRWQWAVTTTTWLECDSTIIWNTPDMARTAARWTRTEETVTMTTMPNWHCQLCHPTSIVIVWQLCQPRPSFICYEPWVAYSHIAVVVRKVGEGHKEGAVLREGRQTDFQRTQLSGVSAFSHGRGLISSAIPESS
jgi:hypothetical protein